MQDNFMRTVEYMRISAGFPFVVNSAYRCPEHNAEVSDTGFDGPHTWGRALDIRVYSQEQASTLMRLIYFFKMTGVGVKVHGPWEGRFLHFDDLTEEEYSPRPAIWSYK